jgi:hypothetical protein
MAELPRKGSRYYTLLIRSSGGIVIKSVCGTRYLWALDTMYLPTTATECERTFSSTQKLINPKRNSLSDATIEASEYLKARWDQGLITRD